MSCKLFRNQNPTMFTCYYVRMKHHKFVRTFCTVRRIYSDDFIFYNLYHFFNKFFNKYSLQRDYPIHFEIRKYDTDLIFYYHRIILKSVNIKYILFIKQVQCLLKINSIIMLFSRIWCQNSDLGQSQS